MNEDNLRIALRAFTRRRLFQPFLVELVTGDRVLVAHPEALTWRGTVLYFISPQDLNRLFDHTSVCQILDVPPATPS
jgi:hypothetical protein